MSYIVTCTFTRIQKSSFVSGEGVCVCVLGSLRKKLIRQKKSVQSKIENFSSVTMIFGNICEKSAGVSVRKGFRSGTMFVILNRGVDALEVHTWWHASARARPRFIKLCPLWRLISN